MLLVIIVNFLFIENILKLLKMLVIIILSNLEVFFGVLGVLVLYEIILLLEMFVLFKFLFIIFWYFFCEGFNKLFVFLLLVLFVVILKCFRLNCVVLRFGMNLFLLFGVFGVFDFFGVFV